MDPQQKDLITGRWRKVRAADPAEHQVQIALIQHLKYRARPGVIYFHVPNGGLRGKAEAAKFKAMGTLPGVTDLIFVWNDGGRLQNLYLELKAKGRHRAIEQRNFAKAVIAAGAHYGLADNIDTALDILKEFHLLKS